MARFPSLKPTSRNYTAGDYPSKEYRSLSGVVAKRSFGNRSTGYKLEVEFANISQSDLRSILAHYEGEKGTLTSFSLPTTLTAGYGTAASNDLLSPNNAIRWFYAGPPEIQSVLRDLSTVRVQFIGELAQ